MMMNYGGVFGDLKQRQTERTSEKGRLQMSVISRGLDWELRDSLMNPQSNIEQEVRHLRVLQSCTDIGCQSSTIKPNSSDPTPTNPYLIFPSLLSASYSANAANVFPSLKHSFHTSSILTTFKEIFSPSSLNPVNFPFNPSISSLAILFLA